MSDRSSITTENLSDTDSSVVVNSINEPEQRRQGLWSHLNGAVLFYTCLPLSAAWPIQLGRVALLAPVIGLGLGGLLALVDGLMAQTGLAKGVVSAVVVFFSTGLTGGLHLDGAMDTADGLAVMEPQRRLAVMADSRAGAFAVMVAIALFTLKIAALSSTSHHRWFALMAAAAWGRWGQQWAIASYPYLKAEGKGAIHKQAIRSKVDTLPGLGLLIGLTLIAVCLTRVTWPLGLGAGTAGLLASVGMAAWLAKKLGGHTGDTYGAVVEWTETAVLIVVSAF